MRAVAIAVVMAVSLGAQTQLDLGRQAKNADFSAFPYTRPLQLGTTLPLACSIGQMFFKTDAPAGSNLYACTATNSWSVQGGTGSIASVFGRSGTVTAQSGDYTTTQVTEGANLYFTTARVLAAMSGLYQAPITTGTTSQYFRGDLSLATFPTTWAWGSLTGVPSAFAPPTPTLTTIGGVKAVDCSGAGQFAQKINTDGSVTCATPSGGGNVSGPGSSMDGYIPLWSGTTGTGLKAGIPTSTFQSAITTGTTSQYFRGDLSLATFPTTWAWGSLTGVPTLTNTVFGRSGTVTAQSGDYTTTQVTEGTNLYFTTARVLAAMSGLYQAPITTGTTSQYFRGDLSLATFPTTWAWGSLTGVPSAFAPPTPTLTTIGGVKAVDCSGAGQFAQKINTDGSVTCATPSGGGNVTGPGSSTDGYIPLWSGTTGTGLKVGIPTSTFQSAITTGTTSQYFRGDLSLATFPTTWAWGSLTGVPTITNTVFGRSGTITAQSGDYTTTQVTEGTNLYFTTARVLAAMSGLYQAPLPVTVNADTSSTATKAVTWAPASTPTVNVGGTTTCDWSVSNVCLVALTGATTLAFSNPHGSGPYLLRTSENAAGGWSYTAFPGAARGISQPDITASAVTEQLITYDGATYNGGAVSIPTAVWRGFEATETGACPATAPVGVTTACADNTVGLVLGRNGGSLYRVLTVHDAPSGAFVGTTDVQALTNKTVDGVSPTTMAYVDVTSSIQTQLNAKSSAITSGTAALGTSAIASGACATVVTSAGTGVTTTDTIEWNFNSDPTSTTGYSPTANGMLTIIVFPSSGNANFKVCNNTSASITPGAVTLNWRVAR